VKVFWNKIIYFSFLSVSLQVLTVRPLCQFKKLRYNTMYFIHVHVLFFLENRLNLPSAKWDYLKNRSNFWCKRKEGTWPVYIISITWQPGVSLSFQQEGNWFSQLCKTFWTETLYKKKFPLDGQTSLAKSAGQFVQCPALNETPGQLLTVN